MRECKTRLALTDGYIDDYGHVNYLNVPKIYELGWDAILAEGGYSLLSIEEKYGIRSFVKKLEIGYLAELFENDEVVVTTRIDFGNTSMIFDQYIERGQQVVSRQKIVMVAVDSQGNKTPLPTELKEAFKG